MTVTPAEISAHHAICHTAFWRPLHDGSEHPPYYVRLTARDVDEIIHTGEFGLPDYLIPESVRQWRSLSEAVQEVARPNPPLTVEAFDLITGGHVRE